MGNKTAVDIEIALARRYVGDKDATRSERYYRIFEYAPEMRGFRVIYL